MAIGADLSVVKGPRAMALVMKALVGGIGDNLAPADVKPAGYKKLPTIYTKTGSDTAPVNDAAGVLPSGVGDLCLHYNAAGAFKGLYRCTAYVSTSDFDWTEICV